MKPRQRIILLVLIILLFAIPFIQMALTPPVVIVGVGKWVDLERDYQMAIDAKLTATHSPDYPDRLKITPGGK